MTAVVSPTGAEPAAGSRNERRYAIAAFCTLLGITAGHTLLETARDALFLARLPASRLPFVYLAIAAVGVLLAQIDRGKQGRWGMAAALGAAAAVNVGFWALLDTESPWTLYALYLWTGLFASWVIVQFWLFLGQLFTMDQAKRLYSFIGIGSVLGALVGAAGARALTMVIDARNLLLGSAALLVLTGVPCVVLLRAEIEEPRADLAQVTRASSLTGDLGEVGGHRYVRRILWLVLTSTVALTIVDYLFKSSVVKHVAPAQMAAFFATVYTILSGLALLVQLVLVGWLLRSLGVHRALRVVPVLVFFGAAFGVLGGGMAAVLVLKGLDGSLRHSLHRTTMELLYVPLPNALRRRAKPFIDLVGQRGGQALASLVILALVLLTGHDRAIKIFLLLLSILWLIAVAGLRQHYLDIFRATLREGALDTHGELPPLDQDALETLLFALNSSRDSEVLAALNLLAEQQRARLVQALILYHPSPPVVLRALDIFVAAKRTDFVPIADRLMIEHPLVEVRTAALRARSLVRPDEKLLRSLLVAETAGPEMRATALVSLISGHWMPPDESRAALLAAATNASPVVRLALARAIRQQPTAESEVILIALAEEGEPAVWIELAFAMATLKSPRYLPALLPMLDNREVRSAARAALAAIGEPALAFLVDAMANIALPHRVRRQIPRALADLSPEPAAAALLVRLGREEDGVLRHRILRALGRVRRMSPSVSLDRDLLSHATGDTIQAIFRHLDWRRNLEALAKEDPIRLTTAQEILSLLLKDVEVNATERLFRLHGLQIPGEDFERIYRGLKNKSAKTRASSRELIENLLASPFRELTLAAVDDAPDDIRLARAASVVPPRATPSYGALLSEIHVRGDATLRSLVAYHASELGIVLTRTGVVSKSLPTTEMVNLAAGACAVLHRRSKPVEAS